MYHLQLTISNEHNQADMACNNIEDYCNLAGFSAEACFRIKVVIAEAINNIINYANPAHPVSVGCQYIENKQELTIEIIDSGEAFDFIPGYEFPECEAESGRGWPIIFSWMDSVSHLRQGQENHLTMKISRG